MQEQRRQFSWDFLSKLILLCFLTLQITRWSILPQFMDMYYHLSTAWGFVKAGGYSGWDFWQFAPAGRIHIYPPLFHITLAMLLKIGVSPVLLAKLFEALMPSAFFITLWYFVRRNFTERLAFFVILIAGGSFSFYASLINHIPATLALVFGLFAFHHLLRRQVVRPAILTTLCFYTHIGVSWFLFLSIFVFGLFNKEERRRCGSILFGALLLSLPILVKQFSGMRFISRLGFNLSERYLLQWKFIEYLLAIVGIRIAVIKRKTYSLFVSLFIASFIFLLYPYRFFSTEGFLPIIFLSALGLDFLYARFFATKSASSKNFIIILVVAAAVFSPTVATQKSDIGGKLKYRFLVGQSAYVGMALPAISSRGFGDTMWLAKDYLGAKKVIEENCADDEIVYSTLNAVGLCLAGISQRATANGLFVEIKPSAGFDPIAVSRVIIATRLDNAQWVEHIAQSYNLTKISEDKMFIYFKNPAAVKIHPQKASVPLGAILCVGAVFLIVFWQAGRIEVALRKISKVTL